MKYEVGQRVRVINNTSGHGFKIGEVLTVRELDYDDKIDSCENDLDYWYMYEEDVEPIEGGNE